MLNFSGFFFFLLSTGPQNGVSYLCCLLLPSLSVFEKCSQDSPFSFLSSFCLLLQNGSAHDDYG